MSHVERSVICVHCQKPHNPGFIWNFSDTLRVCFTCYRGMGDELRDGYERRAGKKGLANRSKPVGTPTRVSRKRRSSARAMSLVVVFLAILAANTWFSDRPITWQLADIQYARTSR
jgi:hypothetical protein